VFAKFTRAWPQWHNVEERGRFAVHNSLAVEDTPDVFGVFRIRPMWMQLKVRTALSLVVLCLIISGCGTGDEMARVKGTVTLNGQPLDGATVEFRPVATEGAPSSGQTDADGHYELMYTFDTPGVIPGEHIVSIRTAGTYFDDEGNELEHEERVPEKYNTRTELKRTVEPGRQTIDFEL
jgi:hypothetical protein